MAMHDAEQALTEPVIIPDLILNGIVASGSQYIVRFTGWVLAPIPGEPTDERRIVVRFAMPIDAARKMQAELAAIMRGGH